MSRPLHVLGEFLREDAADHTEAEWIGVAALLTVLVIIGLLVRA